METQIGIISDTHGLLRPGATDILKHADLIIHAGDIGSPEVLHRLRTLAPVMAVRGNTDSGSWAAELPGSDTIELHGVLIHILHDLSCLDLDPVAAGIAAVISGHSHRPGISRSSGVLYLNPGSAGPRRFDLPVTLALAACSRDGLRPEIVRLAGKKS